MNVLFSTVVLWLIYSIKKFDIFSLIREKNCVVYHGNQLNLTNNQCSRRFFSVFFFGNGEKT